MNNKKRGKIRTVTVNDRGQVVIPEDIRKDMDIESATTLVMIEKAGEIIIRKESDVLNVLDEDLFWKAVKTEALKHAWSEEDEIWDKFAKEDLNE